MGTILGDGAVFEGDFKAPEAVRIDGTVNGNCTCEKELIIGEERSCEGQYFRTARDHFRQSGR